MKNKNEIIPSDILREVSSLQAEIKAIKDVNGATVRRFTSFAWSIVVLEVVNVIVHFFY